MSVHNSSLRAQQMDAKWLIESVAYFGEWLILENRVPLRASSTPSSVRSQWNIASSVTMEASHIHFSQGPFIFVGTFYFSYSYFVWQIPIRVW